MISRMRTLAGSLLQGLKDHGARELFGIPGDFVLPFFKVIEESGILPHYTLSHEPAVGFAADGAARYHSGLGVAVVTFGAGAFNLVNAITGAYAERSPVVVIAGAPGAGERLSGFVLHHQARSVDTQMAVYREITCDQAVLTNALTAPNEIARVLRSARERSLPFAGLGSWVALGKKIRVSSAFCLRLRADQAQKLETIRLSSESGREPATSPVTPVIASSRD